MPNDTAWNKLKDMHNEEEAADNFIQGCKILGIMGDKLFEKLREELESYPTDGVYEGLDSKPSLDGIRQVLANLSTLGCELDVKGEIEAKITQLEESAKASRNSPAQQLTISPTTYGFALLALLDVMAASSKLGLGKDEGIGRVEGAREFSRKLFADTHMVKLIKVLTHLNKTQREEDGKAKFRNFLVPLQFASGVLLSDNVSGVLPKNLDEFQVIQATYFGDCLTQCSLEARKTYHEVLTSEGQDEELGFNKELPSELISMSKTIRENSLQAIKDRVENFEEKGLGDPKDLDLAKKWLRHSLKEEHYPADAPAPAAPPRP